MRPSEDTYTVRQLLGALSSEIEVLAGLVDDVQDAVGTAVNGWFDGVHPDADSLIKLQSLDRISQELWDFKRLADAALAQSETLPPIGTEWIDKAVALTGLRKRLLQRPDYHEDDHRKTVFF